MASSLNASLANLQKQYSDSAFSGEGGLKSDGRWHHKGNRIVYTSQSLSLATLEAWMHIGPQDQMRTYVAVAADIPDDLPLHVIDERDGYQQESRHKRHH